eukprot:scaffold250_cov110-Isochrysis_galbana.AAC.7
MPSGVGKKASQARGDEARKAQGGGKRNLHLVFRGRWTIARGPSHTPFGGAIGSPLGPRGMLVNPTKTSPLIKQKLIHSPLEGKSRAQAVVVHAALTPSPAHSGLKKERGMGKEWGRGGGVCVWTAKGQRVSLRDAASV